MRAAKAANREGSVTAASIQSTAVLSLRSEHTGEVYQISLAFPASYVADRSKVFPVVYAIDANVEFEAVVGLARLMQLGAVSRSSWWWASATHWPVTR